MDKQKIINEGQAAKGHLDIAVPYLEELKANIHLKWEALPPHDEENAKQLKLQLHAINELIRLMKKKVNLVKIMEE